MRGENPNCNITKFKSLIFFFLNSICMDMYGTDLYFTFIV